MQYNVKLFQELLREAILTNEALLLLLVTYKHR